MKIWERARGHWDAILAAANVPKDVLDGKHHPCPVCGGKDRFRYTRDEEGGFFCGDIRGDGLKLLQHVCGVDFKGAAEIVERVIGKDPNWKPEPKTETYAEQLRKIARHAKRSRYLESRGLEVAPGLQFAESVEYRDGEDVIGKFPAMLAPVTRDGAFLTYHVTYLDNGRKANVSAVRKILPGPANTGAAIELYPAAETMGIAEGIETAIAAKMIHNVPVWSAMNTSLLKSWQPPKIAKHILIFGDNDPHFAGHAAAWHLAHKLALAGLHVEVRIPIHVADWNDALIGRKAA
ncbi:MAG: toprim domain-containing protein [Rhodanobacteraceae bacterium]